MMVKLFHIERKWSFFNRQFYIQGQKLIKIVKNVIGFRIQRKIGAIGKFYNNIENNLYNAKVKICKFYWKLLKDDI